MVRLSSFKALAFGAAFANQAVTSPVSVLVPRDIPTLNNQTSVVNLYNLTGLPKHYASGFLYGLPNNENQIPSKFFAGIDFQYNRAGGAQLPAPARGWVWGVNEYKNRFTSTFHNYVTTRKQGGKFIFLIHDLYGADGTQNSSTPYPGDDGSWTYWDNYLTHVIADMKSHEMMDGVVIDIWNEPDLGTVFWGRSQDQYLQMWGRTYYRFRKAFGTSVLLSGPASAGEPLAENTWWTNWASFVSQNGSIPDQYAWHMEGGGGDLISAFGGLTEIQQEYGLPTRQININEYGTYPEQVPAGDVWWISQLERINAYGLRGNWLSGYQLHDYMAGLVGKPNAETPSYSPTGKGYWPTGDYQVYQYYAQNMTGSRVGTLPSEDLLIDTYATVGTDGVVRVLTGVRIRTGTWFVQLNNLTAVGLPESGSLNIHTWGFPTDADNHFREFASIDDLGYYSHEYSGNTVSFPVFQTDESTAYAFTFALDGQTIF